jgi:hypothetical protein
MMDNFEKVCANIHQSMKHSYIFLNSEAMRTFIMCGSYEPKCQAHGTTRLVQSKCTNEFN